MALKKTFSADGKKCKVVFTVKKEAAQGAKSISIAGDFNSWSSTETPLKKAKDGSFSVELELATGICWTAAAGTTTGKQTNIFLLLSAALITALLFV